MIALSSCSKMTSQNTGEKRALKTGPEKVQMMIEKPKLVLPHFSGKEGTKTSPSKAISQFCELTQKKFTKYGWGNSRCKKYNWHHVRNSVWGRPLTWVTYGDEEAHKIKEKSMTLIFCGVHGDEITPIKFCYDVMSYLDKHFVEFSDRLIVVAPIVNPDSFFKKWPTRTNARRIDINRNFPTKDWPKDAIRLWKTRYRSAKRRFPGKKSLSEPEVIFQVNLIKRYKPNKIISVHSPLTMIDYDGPGEVNQTGTGVLANQLLIQMAKRAKGYRIKNYPYFPGSLGNWAGNERQIPTYTLELPSSDNRKHKEYWALFQGAIREAVTHDFTIKDSTVSMNNSLK